MKLATKRNCKKKGENISKACNASKHQSVSHNINTETTKRYDN